MESVFVCMFTYVPFPSPSFPSAILGLQDRVLYILRATAAADDLETEFTATVSEIRENHSESFFN